jgi:hypothetical protein
LVVVHNILPTVHQTQKHGKEKKWDFNVRRWPKHVTQRSWEEMKPKASSTAKPCTFSGFNTIYQTDCLFDDQTETDHGICSYQFFKY